MAHELTERDQMFTVRKPAWHGLGHVFDEAPSREEAQKLAHPWEPVTAPIFAEKPQISEDGDLYTVMEEVPGYKSVVRDDTGDVLGVVSDTYQPIRNQEMYDIAETIEGEAKGDVIFETGGSLKGGSKVWLLIRLRDPIQVGDDAETATIPYFAIQNSHDGSSSFRGQATMTRIVCDNTAKVADLDARQRGTEFTFRHTLNVQDRIDEARQALTGWRESIQAYADLSEHLLLQPVDPSRAKDFLHAFIPEPPPSTASERVLNNVARAREQWWGIYQGETTERITGTEYGLIQTCVEYLNHARRAHTQETLFRRAYLDRDRLVAGAMKTLARV